MGNLCSCSQRASLAKNVDEETNVATSSSTRTSFVNATTAEPMGGSPPRCDAAIRDEEELLIDVTKLPTAAVHHRPPPIKDPRYGNWNKEAWDTWYQAVNEEGDESMIDEDNDDEMMDEEGTEEESPMTSEEFLEGVDRILRAHNHDGILQPAEDQMEVDSDDEARYNDFIPADDEGRRPMGTYYPPDRIRQFVLADGDTMASAEAYMHRCRSLEYPAFTYDPDTMTTYYLWPRTWVETVYQAAKGS